MTQGQPASAAALQNYLVAREGYDPSVTLQFQPLAATCDFFATRVQGDILDIAIIIDRDRSSHALPLGTAAELKKFAQAGAAARPGVRHTRLAIYEIGRNAIDTAAVDRYLGFGERGSILVEAWLLDTVTGKVWTTRPFASLGPRQKLERVLRKRIPGTGSKRDIGERIPVVTGLVIFVLFAIFGTEVVLNEGHTVNEFVPSAGTLTVLGGASRILVVNYGQWWRIFTAPLLHADLWHVSLNCIALFLVGIQLEPLVGSRWFAGMFAVSALCGSLLFVVTSPPLLLCIGASGGIVGVLASGLLLAWRHPEEEGRKALLVRSLPFLIPALAPLLLGAGTGSGIAYMTHLGGALGGVMSSVAALWLWPRTAPIPSRAAIPASIAAIYLLVAAIAFVFVMRR